VPKTGIHLRITRFGPLLLPSTIPTTAPGGELVRYFRMECDAPVKVGVVAQSPTGNGCQVIFQHLTYSPEPVTEIRSGK
jgi:regulation of enolase protein 1 (concanavalin A-like superfamily)